jgi:hypothetical protein
MTEKSQSALETMFIIAHGLLPCRMDLDNLRRLWGALRWDVWPCLWPILGRLACWAVYPIAIPAAYLMVCMARTANRKIEAAQQAAGDDCL